MALFPRELRGRPARAFRVAAAAGLLLAAGSGALAQTEAERWNLSAAGSLSYAEDLFFVGEGGPSDLIGSASVGLGWARVDARTQLTVSGFASYRHYRRFDSFDGGRAALGGSASHAFTPRLRGSVSYGFSRGISALGLGPDEVLLPDIDIRSQAGSSGLSFALTPRTSVSLSGSVSRLEYRAERSFVGLLLPLLGEGADPGGGFGLEPGPDGEPVVADPFEATRQLLSLLVAGGAASDAVTIDAYSAHLSLSHGFSERTRGSVALGRSWLRSDGSALEPQGRQLDVGVGLSHLLAPTWDLSASYSFLTNDAQIPPVDTHAARLGVGKRLNPRLRADAAIGIGVFQASDATSRNLLGSIALSGRGDRSSFTLGYSRSSSQALALGRSFVDDSVNASWSRLLTRRLSASLYAAHRRSRDPLDSFGFDTQLVGVSFARRLFRRSALSASYSFRRLGRQDQPPIRGSVFGLSISYGRIWK